MIGIEESPLDIFRLGAVSLLKQPLCSNSGINGGKIVAKKDAIEIQDTKPGFNLSNFFQETKIELSKVVWPTRQQLISESAAVMLMVTLSAITIYLVDNFFGWIAGKVF